MEPPVGFGPLEAALEAVSAVYTNDKVRSQTPTQDPSLTTYAQEWVTVRRIEGLLSRIAALEALFATSPGSVEEQRRRKELIRYAHVPPLDLALSVLQHIRGH